MTPLNFSYPFAVLASGCRIDSRIRLADKREPTCVRSGPIAPPSPLILWQAVQPAPRIIVIGSVLPPAIPGPPPPPGGEPPAGVVEAGMSDALTSTVPPFDSKNATSAHSCCGESVRPISGMMGSLPCTTKARRYVTDPGTDALQTL